MWTELDAHSIFVFLKNITLILIIAFVARQSIHFLLAMGAAQELWENLIRCSMYWENDVENMLRHPEKVEKQERN